MSDNPLLTLEFHVPFDRILAEHVEPAIQVLLIDARSKLEAIAADSAPRTYANTMLALEHITERLDYAMGVVRHLESVRTTPELRAAFNAVEPQVSEFYSSISLHAGLWKQVKSFGKSKEAGLLNAVKRRFVTKTIESFRRHGADLDEAGKIRLAEIDVELAKITTKFGENVLDSTNAFELVIQEEARLAGLPPTAVAAARQSAEAKNQSGWRFTLQGPSYIAAMTYLDDRSVRRELFEAFAGRATESGFDNRPLLGEILRLRQQKAELLGFRNFADLVLNDRMAHDGRQALSFLQDMERKTRSHFERENRQLRDFADTHLEGWDIAYLAERQRRALYDFDEEELRPYFRTERVIEGMFAIVRKLYGISVTQEPGVAVWHPDVKFYEIRDDSGLLLGAFYADWFPREDKRGGAWMDAFLTGAESPGFHEPHLGAICGNMTAPIGSAPALLTHREVETIFHEFGHLLHHCLSRVEVKSLAGTNVAWDFVELPSQIMENWCWERDALDLFACHHETGAPIPLVLFEKLTRARNFRVANMQMRQLGFGIVDLSLHMEFRPERDGDPLPYAREILSRFSAATLPANYAMIASFTHLFASPVGYGAGYYSYKWAEVLDADAFTRFQREGIFSREAGSAFQNHILSKGNSQEAAELYRGFMGRDPDPGALLRRFGLSADTLEA